MLGDISGLEKIYIVCGYTDMRKSIDGLCAVIEDQLKMDPSSSALFLFCGRRRDRIKALFKESDGFVLIYKRLSVRGGYQWPESTLTSQKLSKQNKNRLDFRRNPAQKKAEIPCKFSTFQEPFSFSKSPVSDIIEVANPRRETMASSAKDIQLRELKDTVSQLKTMISEQTELIKSLRLIIDEKSSHEKANRWII